MLQIGELTYRIAGRTLLDNVSLSLPAGHHAGLIGRNGTGKSTLLKLIAGSLQADGGDINLPANTRISMLAQEKPCLPPIRSARGCWPRPKPPVTPTASAKFTPGLPISKPIARRRARRRSWPGSGSIRPSKPGPAGTFQAAGACAWRLRRCFSPRRICCCSTSRPTTSISRPPSGSRTS